MSTSQDADLLFTKYGVYEGIIPYPSVDLMQIASGALTLEDFLVIGDIWSQLVHRYLSRPSHILDIGCGCARTARFLVPNAFVQSYTGFDVQPAAINWDQQYIQPYSRGRFAFVHSDVYNGLYNPSGTLSCSEYSFPVRSGSIDIAYAASLFTHLLEADCEHYLVETARALKPDGWLIASIHDQQIGESAFVGSEARIDIHPDYFAKKAGAAGLQLESNLGYVGGQRIMVFKKLGPVSSVRRLSRWLFRRLHRTVTVGERRIDRAGCRSKTSSGPRAAHGGRVGPTASRSASPAHPAPATMTSSIGVAL